MTTTEEDLINQIKLYDPKANTDLIYEACMFAKAAHTGQVRESGEPYYYHPLEVSIILAEMKLDTASIITALLHDTVEDTSVTLEDIESKFGSEVSKLVDGVTKLGKIETQSENIRQAENFRKLLLAMSEDIRVLVVKLADRVHNMRTLQYREQEKRLKTAHETMEIYAPLAERIGIQAFKSELQELAFAELYPEAHNSIVNRLDFLRKEGGSQIIDNIAQDISNIIKENQVDALVFGREKSACSIWYKMKRKNLGFEQLSDIMAFRIMVSSVLECYQVLGVIHSNYHMVPDSFKDFISTPKNNGYQSLHTIVMGPLQHRIEIQIRTQKMHEVAEYGVAAHWSYKQDYQYNIDGKQYRWIRELLSILEQASDPEEFLENTKMEMYYDQVFCFTPKGNLIVLPKGATPVDFAYAVHSNVGHTCVGAKINGRIVPLRTILQNGDQVEIIRSKTQVPSVSWEKFVVTGKARAEIRRFTRAQQRDEYITLGRSIMSKSVKNENNEYSDKLLEATLEHFKKKNVEDLLALIGEGIIERQDVINQLFPASKKKTVTKIFKNSLSFFNFKKNPKIKSENTVQIKGLVPGMALHYAGCCHPLPGDNIVGIVNTGKGVTIHTVDCETLSNFASMPERWLDVSWDKESNNEAYVGRVKIILSHEQGSLAALASIIAREHGNIYNLKIVNRTRDFFEIILDVEVRGTTHLSNIISAIRSKSCIYSIERFKA